MEYSGIDLQKFYPECLLITGIKESANQIVVEMKSHTREHICPFCNTLMLEGHGTYIRRAQDLPIFNMNVQLKITANEYLCRNGECGHKVVSEDFDGFLGRYSRMTARCEDMIIAIALKTSCEGAASICAHMGIRVSGDTIIRMLKRVFEQTQIPQCSETIGVDDFSSKKGRSYYTIVCDGESRKPVAILDGRDGSSFKEWLQNNKHVKAVTRDRASAYARAISDVLPDAMQIADRFHLYQNLLGAVKEALKSDIPNRIAIPDIPTNDSTEQVPVEQKNNKATGTK